MGRARLSRVLALTGLLACALSCARASPAPDVAPPPIQTLGIREFRCHDTVLGEAVRNVFIAELVARTGARIVRDGEADAWVEGTVSAAAGGTQSGSIGGGGGGWGAIVAGKTGGVSGTYVSGVTALVVMNGAFVGSSEFSMHLSDDVIYSPEWIARQAAERLARNLLSQRLVPRRR